MKLCFEQICAVTTGAVRIQQENDGIHFYRFTKEQEEMFLPRNQKFYNKTFSTPGIRLRFTTNSRNLGVRFSASYASPRSFFALDLSVNGVSVESVDNFSQKAPKENYGELEYPYGVFSKNWQLGEGEKEINICLPWSVKFVLEELSLEDGATLAPAIPGKKALCFGDSITHGSDALYPHNRYISQFCDYLGAAEHCKAICGETFWPELAATKEPFDPDYIIVAYGTNDWSHDPLSDLTAHCYGFYRNLAANYPNAKLIAISPLWRADQKEKNRQISLTAVHDLVCDAVKDNPNAVVLRGYDLVPHETGYFGDLRLHPNDMGFQKYYENLVREYEKGSAE